MNCIFMQRHYTNKRKRICALVDENKTNGAIAIGLIDSNGTQFYSHGKMSNTSNAIVDEIQPLQRVLLPKYSL